jgi:hypothetical protein
MRRIIGTRSSRLDLIGVGGQDQESGVGLSLQ